MNSMWLKSPKIIPRDHTSHEQVCWPPCEDGVTDLRLCLYWGEWPSTLCLDWSEWPLTLFLDCGVSQWTCGSSMMPSSSSTRWLTLWTRPSSPSATRPSSARWWVAPLLTRRSARTVHTGLSLKSVCAGPCVCVQTCQPLRFRRIIFRWNR